MWLLTNSYIFNVALKIEDLQTDQNLVQFIEDGDNEVLMESIKCDLKNTATYNLQAIKYLEGTMGANGDKYWPVFHRTWFLERKEIF